MRGRKKKACLQEPQSSMTSTSILQSLFSKWKKKKKINISPSKVFICAKLSASGTVGGQKTSILQSQQDELETEKDFHRPDPPNEMKEVNPTSPPCCSVPRGLPLTGSAVALNPMSWPHARTSPAINPDAVQAVFWISLS